MLPHKTTIVNIPNVASDENVALVKFKKGDRLHITPESVKCKKPPFLGIFGGEYMKENTKNLLQQLGDMTAAERWFFLLVEKHMDYSTNSACIPSTSLTHSQMNIKTIAFKSLKEKNLIKRIKREHYMINPDIIIPLGIKPNGNEIYPDVKDVWDALP